MAVSNESIMNQMKKELQQATLVAEDATKWTVHIAHVKLLSELLLNEQGKIDAEVDHMKGKAMMQSTHTTSKTEQDDGTSIFDF